MRYFTVTKIITTKIKVNSRLSMGHPSIRISSSKANEICSGYKRAINYNLSNIWKHYCKNVF